MLKKITIAVMLLSLVSLLGCEEISSLTEGQAQTSSDSNLKIVKAVELGAGWEMKQMTFTVGAGKEVLILLKLSPGDKVDGYFYLEKGEDIGFSITGKTLLYRTAPRVGADGTGTSSDRFSFTTTEEEGDTYTLAFRNPAGDEERQTPVAVFLEVIFPASGSIYIPVDDE